MKKSWLYIFLLSFFLCLCVLFTSCATKPKTEYITETETKIETITETEYVPVYIDLNDTIKTVIQYRPNNSKYAVKTGTDIKNLFDLMGNSISYMTAWIDWQEYAELLENTLYICRDKCMNPSAISNSSADAQEIETEPVETEPVANKYVPSDLTIPVIG